MERYDPGSLGADVFGVTARMRDGAFSPALSRPTIDQDSEADRDFARFARKAGMDPADRWVGGYADYEWDHLRKLIEAYGITVDGKDILEFGCNVGASSVVMAALGGAVTAIDVSPDAALIAQANIDRHGLRARASARHVPDTRQLPFADSSFDLILANSVLEYVEPDQLDGVLAELHRVLRGNGLFLVCGTASRVALREIHSGRWFVNYLPRALDRLTGRQLQRGLCPLALASGIKGRFVLGGHGRWLEARRAVHGKPSMPMYLVDRIAAMFGCAPGWLTPHIELLLKKAAVEN